MINKRLQMLATVEPSFQDGLLSTPFHRVYFTNGSETTERLPGTRLKFPVSLRANYFEGDRAIIRSFYRFYVDDWGMVAHTASIEVPVKLTPFLSVSPFYRFHAQTAVRYFRPIWPACPESDVLHQRLRHWRHDHPVYWFGHSAWPHRAASWVFAAGMRLSFATVIICAAPA